MRVCVVFIQLGLALTCLARMSALAQAPPSADPKPDRESDGPAEYVRRAMTATEGARGIAILTEGIRLFPRDARLWAARSQVRLLEKDSAGSLKDAEEAIRLNPAVSDGWTARGMNRMGQQRWEDAAADFDLALGIHSDPLAWVGRGRCRLELGRPAAAVKDFDRALETNPSYLHALELRADAYRALGQYDRALADATRAVRLTPDNPERRQRRATIYGSLGQPRKAVAEISMALELAPRETALWLDRAQAYRYAGQLEYALRDANRAVQLAPDTGWGGLWAERAAIHVELGHGREALADYGEGLRRSPDRADIWAGRAGVSASLGDWVGAVADMGKATGLAPKAAEYWHRSGLYQMRSGDLPGAIRATAHAIDLSPSSGRYRADLAALQAEQGDLAAARASLDTAIKAADVSPIDFARAALLALDAGKPARARAVAREAARRFRESATVEPLLDLAEALATTRSAPDDCRQVLKQLSQLEPPREVADRAELAAASLLVRCGKWSRAQIRLERMLKSDQLELRCQAQLWLAIALAKDGQAEQARAALGEARKKVAAIKPTPAAEAARTPKGARLIWPARLWREALLREAEATVAPHE
jgi:tetratricopeptide (TPR) repeat protein